MVIDKFSVEYKQVVHSPQYVQFKFLMKKQHMEDLLLCLKSKIF